MTGSITKVPTSSRMVILTTTALAAVNQAVGPVPPNKGTLTISTSVVMRDIRLSADRLKSWLH